MKNYDHLDTIALDSRYVLAASHVADATSVLEIGGDKMWKFLSPYWNLHKPELGRKIECIDPVASNPPLLQSVVFHKVPIQEFDMETYLKRASRGKKAVVMIGIEWDISRDELSKLIDQLSRFDTIVMDHVMSNQTATLQASLTGNALMYKRFVRRVEMLIAVRYDHRYMTSREIYTPSLFKNRLFQVFEKNA